ncbi:MAG TPA: Gfo/Idh/MocA family oxidoreductase [Ignavibacteria bacterium]|nr:Gfo/Idh/MocA family oxidoreductase [Ignavibacteria bacterium]
MIKYNAGIIGCGDIGFLFDHNTKIQGALTHFKAFSDSDKFNLTAASELKKEIRNLIQKEYKTPVYSDYKKMLDENRFDVISIASNDESHIEILENIVKYKPKLVFCEKPLGLNLSEIRSIISLYKKNGILLQVNYTRRFLDEFDLLEKIIKGKKLGEIESMTFYYSRGLIHNASHYLDLINRYIGETEKNLVKVSVKKGISKTDDTISFDMIYKSGLEVRFIGLNPSKLSFAEIDIAGTKGRVRINYKNEIEIYKTVENKIYKGYQIYEMTSCKKIEFSKALPNAVKNIYNVLEGREKMKSGAENSVKIFELINRIKDKPLCQN